MQLVVAIAVNAVQLDAIALRYEFGDALRELGEYCLHVASVGDHAVLDHVLGKTSGGQRALVVHIGEPAVDYSRCRIGVLLEHVAH
jgi:hypothetical protein